MADLYEAVFQWPSVSHGHVVVTGTFDNWSQSVPLSKTSSGFEGTVKLPWDSDITYKFVVDGQWLVDDRQPTRFDGSGAVNNIIHTPKKPEPTPVVAEPTPEPVEEATPVVEPASESVVVEKVEEPTPLEFAPEPELTQPAVLPVVPEPVPASDPVPENLFTIIPTSKPTVPVVPLLPSEDALPSTDPVKEVVEVAAESTPAPAQSTAPVAEEEKPATEAPSAEAAAPAPSESVPTVEVKTEDAAVKPTEEKPAEERLSRDPKPRLNGVGSLKSTEQRRSRTLSSIGSIRSKIFPRVPTPTDDKHAPENGSDTKAPNTPERPKRLSFFGKLRNAIKPSP